MRKNYSKYIWGAVLIILGVFVALRSFNVINGSIFFTGWWTLFIIVPSAISFITNHNKFWDGSFFLIGVAFLMAANKWYINYDNVWAIALCLFLINIGISIMSGGKAKKAHVRVGDSQSFIGIFSSCNEKPVQFNGGTAVAVFGGVDIDLRDVVFSQDVYLTAVSVFGGVDIYINDNINVICSTANIFGGTDNEQQPIDGNKTLYIDGCAVFGGIDIKKYKKH